MSTQTIALEGDALVEARQVGGNLEVDSWDRPEVEARGDQLRVERRPGAVAIACTGDLSLRLPKSARLTVGTIGGDILLQNLDGAVEIRLVGGDATLRNLSGLVSLVGMVGGDLHMENVSKISMSSGKAGDRFGFADRVRRKVEKAARQAEVRIRRGEHRAFRHGWKGWDSGDLGRWGFGSEAESRAPSEPREPVSDEERMAVLRMLQEKKITAEQAEQLLSALEGKA